MSRRAPACSCLSLAAYVPSWQVSLNYLLFKTPSFYSRPSPGPTVLVTHYTIRLARDHVRWSFFSFFPCEFPPEPCPLPQHPEGICTTTPGGPLLSTGTVQAKPASKFLASASFPLRGLQDLVTLHLSSLPSCLNAAQTSLPPGHLPGAQSGGPSMRPATP